MRTLANLLWPIVGLFVFVVIVVGWIVPAVQGAVKLVMAALGG